MKKYKAIFYLSGAQGSCIIYARSREEAWRQAWELTEADDVYLEEVTEDGSSKEL